MRLTRHNGRAGKNGVYNPKHNDRRFDVNNSEHIDAERVSQNIYWDCIHGYRTINDQRNPDEALETFSEIERLFYEQRYAGFVEGQNARNAKTQHIERKPEHKADARIRNYAISQMGKLREMITSAVAKLSPNLAQLLKLSELKQLAVQDIGKKVRPSVMAMLRQKKEESVKQTEEQKRQVNRKQNMEL